MYSNSLFSLIYSIVYPLVKFCDFFFLEIIVYVRIHVLRHIGCRMPYPLLRYLNRNIIFGTSRCKRMTERMQCKILSPQSTIFQRILKMLSYCVFFYREQSFVGCQIQIFQIRIEIIQNRHVSISRTCFRRNKFAVLKLLVNAYISFFKMYIVRSESQQLATS